MRTNYDLRALNRAIEAYVGTPTKESYQTALVDAIYALKDHIYKLTVAEDPQRDVGEDDIAEKVQKEFKKSSLKKYYQSVELTTQLESLYASLNLKYMGMYSRAQDAAMAGLAKLPGLAAFIGCAEEMRSEPAAQSNPDDSSILESFGAKLTTLKRPAAPPDVRKILGGILLVLAALTLTAFAALIAASLILGAPITIPVVGAAVAAVVALQSVSIAIPIAVAAVAAVGAVAGILASAIPFHAARLQVSMRSVLVRDLPNILPKIVQLFRRASGTKSAGSLGQDSQNGIKYPIGYDFPAGRPASPGAPVSEESGVASPPPPGRPQPPSPSRSPADLRGRFDTSPGGPSGSAPAFALLTDDHHRQPGGGDALPSSIALRFGVSQEA